MSFRKLVAAGSAIAALAAIAPVTAASAQAPAPAAPAGPGGMPNLLQPNPNLCLQGFADHGPFGPSGPYGASGPYGPNGPLANVPNPIGNAAQCGGLITFILRGGTVSSYVQATIAPFVGH